MSQQAKTQRIRDTISRSRFVIAETNDDLRGLTHFALESFGAGDIIEVRDGRGVISAVATNRADVAIIGWRMWPVDGPTTVSYLRGSRAIPLSRLPIIVIAEREDVWNVIAAKILRVDDFIVWPMSARFLCGRVAQAILWGLSSCDPRSPRQMQLPAPHADRGIPLPANEVTVN